MPRRTQDADLSTDLIIAGGGLSGTAAALAALRSGLEAVHLSPAVLRDARTSALMAPSVATLETLNFADDLKAIGTPLRRIRIIDATGRLMRAPETLFDSADANLDALGWNFPNAALLEAMQHACSANPRYRAMDTALDGVKRDDDGVVVTAATGQEVRGALLVGADGKSSRVRALAGIDERRRDYGQSALVCDLELERSLEDTSVEFHYPNGPFTLVPAGDRACNLVWIDTPGALDVALGANRDDFCRLLSEKSSRLFGKIALRSKPVVFPLASLIAARAGADRTILIGESAHAFPPIGAQGLNLSLRDVDDFGRVLAEADMQQPDWAVAVADSFAARRAGDMRGTAGMVDTLFGSLLSASLPAQGLRAGGLWALKTLPGLRRGAFKIGMGAR